MWLAIQTKPKLIFALFRDRLWKIHSKCLTPEVKRHLSASEKPVSISGEGQVQEEGI